LEAASKVQSFGISERIGLEQTAIHLLQWLWERSASAESEHAAKEFSNFASPVRVNKNETHGVKV
jgi:hypothetical protein